MPALLPLLAVAAASTTFNVPATLNDQVPRAIEESGIPVLVPETIRSEFKKLYGNILPAPEGRYGLVLGAAKDCNGASVCGVANFYGHEGAKRRGGRKVTLAKGRTGYYTKSKCGANCSFPAVQWKQRGVLYTIEYKEGTGVKDLKVLANSAIKAGPR